MLPYVQSAQLNVLKGIVTDPLSITFSLLPMAAWCRKTLNNAMYIKYYTTYKGYLQIFSALKSRHVDKIVPPKLKRVNSEWLPPPSFS